MKETEAQRCRVKDTARPSTPGIQLQAHTCGAHGKSHDLYPEHSAWPSFLIEHMASIGNKLQVQQVEEETGEGPRGEEGKSKERREQQEGCRIPAASPGIRNLEPGSCLGRCQGVRRSLMPPRVGGGKGQKNRNSSSHGECHVDPEARSRPSRSRPSILCTSFHLILPRILSTLVHHYPHFAPEESEASRC